jgi:hypothetical protein
MAQALRLILVESTTRAAMTASQARDQVRLLRTCTSTVILCLFFNNGGSGIDCLTEDLVAVKNDGIRLYHRTRKGQRAVSTKRKLLCHLQCTLRLFMRYCFSIHFDVPAWEENYQHRARQLIRHRSMKDGQLTHSHVSFTRLRHLYKSPPPRDPTRIRTPYEKEPRSRLQRRSDVT